MCLRASSTISLASEEVYILVKAPLFTTKIDFFCALPFPCACALPFVLCSFPKVIFYLQINCEILHAAVDSSSDLIFLFSGEAYLVYCFQHSTQSAIATSHYFERPMFISQINIFEEHQREQTYTHQILIYKRMRK